MLPENIETKISQQINNNINYFKTLVYIKNTHLRLNLYIIIRKFLKENLTKICWLKNLFSNNNGTGFAHDNYVFLDGFIYNLL